MTQMKPIFTDYLNEYLQVANVGISNLSWVLLFLVLVLENLHLGLGIFLSYFNVYNLFQIPPGFAGILPVPHPDPFQGKAFEPPFSKFPGRPGLHLPRNVFRETPRSIFRFHPRAQLRQSGPPRVGSGFLFFFPSIDCFLL